MSSDRKRHWTLAAFEIDKAYGGSEEGGWWYNTGTLERIIACRFCTEEEAFKLSRHANDWLYRLQKGL
jgi:hypothetical protein